MPLSKKIFLTDSREVKQGKKNGLANGMRRSLRFLAGEAHFILREQWEYFIKPGAGSLPAGFRCG
jgi:hypothetical protein